MKETKTKNETPDKVHSQEEIYDAMLHLSPEYRERLEAHIKNSPGTFVWKMQNFSRFVPRQILSRFLHCAEMFRRVLQIQGSIIECGVLGGGGLMTWAQLSAIYEPLNVQRKVIGFDTFSGFPAISEKDAYGASPLVCPGALSLDSYEDLQESIALYNTNRFLANADKVQLIKGDIVETVPKYLEENPETIISLIYMDVDIYEPTKIALENFVPRMPKGAIVAFDELNNRTWPGETLALIDTLGIRNLKLERFSYDTKVCYAVLDQLLDSISHNLEGWRTCPASIITMFQRTVAENAMDGSISCQVTRELRKTMKIPIPIKLRHQIL